jgi:hypothetical protein
MPYSLNGIILSELQMKRSVILLLPAILLFSCTCNNEPGKQAGLPAIDSKDLPVVTISIKRYEKALFSLDISRLQSELKGIQKEYAVFLDGDLDDKQNLQQLEDYLGASEIRNNYNACINKYPDLAWLEKDLSAAFSRFKYYFPESKVPQTYTYVSGGDFSQPVKFVDSSLIIALDIYLGRAYPFYAACGIPQYKSRFMDRSYIVRDCIEEMLIAKCSDDIPADVFLDRMINMGKVFCLLEAVLPGVPDSIVMKYSKMELDWCRINEGNVWAFFIENKLLYTQDRNTLLKFFGDGPFTASFGKESPARIALWVGRQIVRAYMNEAEDKDILKLIAEKDAQKILQQSKYKPKKQN